MWGCQCGEYLTFTRNPKTTIQRVISELNEYGVDIESFNDDTNIILNHSELLERVKIGARRILDDWDCLI